MMVSLQLNIKEGDSYDYTASSWSKISSALSKVGVEIPSYMQCEPPTSGELDLIEPNVIALACEKIIEFLTAKDTPNEDINLNRIKVIIENVISCLNDIKQWSKDGYYLTMDID